MVVTIVILLILAGVSISLILDNNGIIKKSKDARKEYKQAQEEEEKDFDDVSDFIEEATAEPAPKVNVNEKAEENSTINGKRGSANNPTIPKGYTPINTDTSEWGDGNKAPTRNSVNHGLVIKDDNNNEWVWIPVSDVNEMCDTKNQIEYTLCGTNVKTKLYSKSEIISETDRNTPGTTDFREPDLVVGTAWSDTKYYNTLGFDSIEKMAEEFVANYNEMIASVTKYGGFYIGRYELSSEGTQKDKFPLYRINWYNAYVKCKTLNASEEVKTEMIWGCQWDVTCNFIANKGDKKEIIDSSSWGNYQGVSVKADDGITKINKQTLNTGETTFTMANNIYDLAGNLSEWTQEASRNSSRVLRGGHFCYR